jgi:hypothetical protein
MNLAECDVWKPFVTIRVWMCRLKKSCDNSWLNMTIGFAMIGWCDDWLGTKDPIPKMHINALRNIAMTSGDFPRLNKWRLNVCPSYSAGWSRIIYAFVHDSTRQMFWQIRSQVDLYVTALFNYHIECAFKNDGKILHPHRLLKGEGW